MLVSYYFTLKQFKLKWPRIKHRMKRMCKKDTNSTVQIKSADVIISNEEKLTHDNVIKEWER